MTTTSHQARQRANTHRGPWALALLLLLAAVVEACGSVPRRYYFALTYPMEPIAEAAGRAPLHPFRLRIRPFRITLPYDRPQIVYRKSPFEFNYYAYKLWAAKPQHMLRELVERHVDSARLVQDVSREYGEELPDYELSAEVLAIEELDSGDVWYGHLAMRFELVRFADKIPVWTYFFDRKKKVWDKQPVQVVRMLSTLAEEEMARVTAGLDGILSKERGVERTLELPAISLDDVEIAPGSGVVGPPVRVGPAERPVPAVEPDDELILPEEPGALPIDPGRPKQHSDGPDEDTGAPR